MNTLLRRTLSYVTGGLLSVFSFAAAATELPAVGSVAPEFSLPDQHGNLRQLHDWRGKWVVLYFYPKDDTPGCTEEACTFRDDLDQLTALDAQVVGVSVDTSESHKAFAEKYKLPFPLLADAKADVAVRYGALSNWLVIKLAKRYTFLIDPQGKVAKAYLSVNTSRHSEEIVNDLKRFKQSKR
jgi:thioredoxin-dependent peroxiredoxin